VGNNTRFFRDNTSEKLQFPYRQRTHLDMLAKYRADVGIIVLFLASLSSAIFLIRDKGKSHPMTCLCRHRGEEQFYLESICNVDTGGRRRAPAALPLGETRYSLYRGLGWLRSRPGPCGISRRHRDSILMYIVCLFLGLCHCCC
jgi:hypothetical protein